MTNKLVAVLRNTGWQILISTGTLKINRNDCQRREQIIRNKTIKERERRTEIIMIIGILPPAEKGETLRLKAAAAKLHYGTSHVSGVPGGHLILHLRSDPGRLIFTEGYG